MSDSDATAVSNAHPVRVADRYRRPGGEIVTIVRPSPMMADAWTYKDSRGEFGTVSDEWARENWALLDAPPAVSPPDAPPWWYCEPCDVRVASSLVHACKPAAATKAPDRSGCKAWCGYDYNRIKENLGSAVYGDWMRTAAHPLGSLTFCSAACRDAKFPPMEAKAPAKPAMCQACEKPATWGDGERCWCDAHGKPTPAPVARQAKCIDATERPCPTAPLLRHFRGKQVLMCDHHWVGRESDTAQEMVMDGLHTFKTNILRDSSRPELLPRARLAADWFEDCLPEAGR